jgi:hypothetical protein
MNRWGVHLCAALALAAASACGATDRSTPQATVPTPLPTAITVEIRGVVHDMDTGAPVPGADVAVVQVAANSAYRNFPGPTVTTDQLGRYTTTVALPVGWVEALMQVQGPGLEQAQTYIKPAGASAADLQVYRAVVLRPGESVDTQLARLGGSVCGWESWLCRRVVVDGWLPGSKIEVQLTPLEGRGDVGVIPTSEPWPFSDYQHRVEITRGEVFIIGSPARVRLTASRR